MEILLAFGLLVLIVAGMAVGVMMRRNPIAGSCGGLNNIGDGDTCTVCGKAVGDNSDLKSKFACPSDSNK